MHGDKSNHRLPLRRALVLGALAIATLAGTAGSYTLEKVSLESRGSEVVFRVAAGQERVLHKVFLLEDPWRLVVDLDGADQALTPKGAAPGQTGFVQTVRASLWKDAPQGRVVRYVLDLDGPADYEVESGAGFLQVTICAAGGAGSTGAEALEDAAPGVPVGLHSPDPGAGVPAVAVPKPLASGTFAAFAQDMDVFVRQDPAPYMGEVDPGSPRGAVQARTEPISLDVQNAELRSVLRTVSEFGGVNIVPDREVGGPITVRMDTVPWRQALDIVCRAAGLVALDHEDYIRVATLRTWRDERIEEEASARTREDLQPLVSRVFPVRYASAEELVNSVAFALSQRGNAEVDGRTNSILVHDIEPRLGEIGGLIETLDTETKQVEIVARLVDVDQGVARQLGIDWSLRNLHSSSERVSGSVGMSESLLDASLTTRVGVVRDFGTLDATIEALERSNEARLISNPKITTVNNRKARILVGKEVPLIVMDEAGNPTTELKRVGIALEVTPYINSDNRITMDLHPEVSDLSAQATVQGGLIFTTTIADTRVMVNDGETAVIGGLIRSSETQFEKGIPLLRSIPLLGALFRQSDTRTESRELLIFVSPRVVDPGMAQADN